MKYSRVCLYCGNNFVTNQNAKKFCRKKCSIFASKKKLKKESERLCQWCGDTFSSERSRKFCTPECYKGFMQKNTIYQKRVVKIPVKITLKDAVDGAKKEGLTYGRYVSFKKICYNQTGPQAAAADWDFSKRQSERGDICVLSA